MNRLDIMKEVDDVRDEFLKIFMENPMSLNKTSYEIGIYSLTLRRFMDGHNSAFTTLCKIKKWIADQKSSKKNSL